VGRRLCGVLYLLRVDLLKWNKSRGLLNTKTPTRKFSTWDSKRFYANPANRPIPARDFEGSLHESKTYKIIPSGALRPLLGPSSEEPQDNPGRGPVVVLIKISSERGPVVVHIEQTDLEVSGRVDI